MSEVLVDVAVLRGSQVRMISWTFRFLFWGIRAGIDRDVPITETRAYKPRSCVICGESDYSIFCISRFRYTTRLGRFSLPYKGIMWKKTLRGEVVDSRPVHNTF